ncbi:aspartate/glutamate racemase family protein [Paenarthrobacter nicotinovorans]|uniref:aspartate/glutamate racemase family protein n=1 Tax=Paenarthrobacter nicotinovorans TaxID=29320 RepID=UPI00382D45BA
MKLWYQSTLNFEQHPNYHRALIEHCSRIASPGTEVVIRGRPRTFGGDLTVGDYNSTPIMFHSVVAPTYVASLLEAEESGADAFIVASFSEPILPELRSLAQIPVISMSEATFMAATMNAPQVGLITLNSMVLPFLEKSRNLHKWNDRLSGIHLLDEPVNEFSLDQNWSTPAPYLELLERGARAAIAAGAGAVIPAEGVLAVMAAVNGLTHVDGTALIDAVGTSVLFAELSVELKQKTGLMQSRRAYPRPNEAALKYLRTRSDV